MNKLVLGLLGAFAFGASALPSAAAPSIAAPLAPAVFHADGTDAHVTTVQYRREEFRRGPPRHYRHYRHHRRHYRSRLFRGH